MTKNHVPLFLQNAVGASPDNHPIPTFVPLSGIVPKKAFRPTKFKSFNSRVRKCPETSLFTYLRIYRKTISNLKIREDILRSVPSEYSVGPTLIWTEDADDLSIFTDAESYTNHIGFESPFSNPRSPKYLKKILEKMRMTKGTVLIKESTQKDAMHIPVHFCAYCVDSDGTLAIFDPSWHSADPGIYSTTAFYDSLDAFGIQYKHAEPMRSHHWQSILPNDVFCQTWTLQWLIQESSFRSGVRSRSGFPFRSGFPLPKTRLDAAKHIAKYMKELSTIVVKKLDIYMSVFPTYKLEHHNPTVVFRAIISNAQLVKYIYNTF
jgi:hypothetical protein